MRRVRIPLVVVAFVAAVATGEAQSTGGTETRVVLAHGTPAAGGRGLGSLGDATAATVGQVATGPTGTSPNYTLESGIAWMVPEVTVNTPIVFGVNPATSTKDGGKLVRVFGYNFQAPGAGALSIAFGGDPATSFVISNSQATAVTPGKVDALGNPPPKAPVQVTTLQGTHAAQTAGLQSSFLYEPALTAVDHPRIGRPLHMHVFTEPGDLLILVLGQTIPGFGAPVPPIEGAAEVILNPQFVFVLVPAPTGQYEHIASVPDNPVLVGGSVFFQILSFTDVPSLDGAFGNALEVTIFP